MKIPTHIYKAQDYALERARKEWGPLAFAVLQPFDHPARLCFVGTPDGPKGYGLDWKEAFSRATPLGTPGREKP
jgi:hypothetical protein